MLTPKTDLVLDIFGQQTGMKIYTQLTWCFRTTSIEQSKASIQILQNGLVQLSAAFPWLAGKVIVEDAGDNNSGIVKIRIPQSTSALRNVAQLQTIISKPESPAISFESLSREGFPMRLLHEDIVAPCRTIPQLDDGSDQARVESEWPVFLTQVTIIDGGILVTFVGHHAVMDMTSQGELIRLLDKACHGEILSEDETKTGNRDRTSLIPPLDRNEGLAEVLIDQMIATASANQESEGRSAKEEGHAVEPATCIWQYYNFNSYSLASLKTLASGSVSPEASLAYVSTDDALTAFTWRSITRVRSARFCSFETQTSLARAVDARRYLELPASTQGLIQNMAYNSSPVCRLLDQSLGTTALLLRRAIDPATSSIAHRTKALATYLSSTPNKTGISFTARLEPSKDLALSSWSKIKAYDFDFGLGLGKPLAVRRPAFTPVEGLVYFMPKDHAGGIAVAICLRNEDMQRLREDEAWTKYAEFIG